MGVVVPLDLEMRLLKDQEPPVAAMVLILVTADKMAQPIPAEGVAGYTRDPLAAAARVLWWRVIWARVLRGPVDRSPPAPAVQAVTRYTPSPLQAR